MTLITLGRKRSGGEREEPLAAPPSPPRLSSGEKAASTTCPGLFLRRRRLLHLLTPPRRAPPRRRVRPSAPRWPACGLSPGVRAPAAPAPHPSRTRARALALPRLTLRGSGRVKSGAPKALPNQRSCRCCPPLPHCAPDHGPGLRADWAAREGPKAGSPGAWRASGECRGVRASWVALRSPDLPRGATPAPGCTQPLHPTRLEPPTPAAPGPAEACRTAPPAPLGPASVPASILGYSPGSPSTGHLPSARSFRPEAKTTPLLLQGSPGGAWNGGLRGLRPRTSAAAGEPPARPHPKPTPPPPPQTKLNRKQNGGSSTGLPPRAKPVQPQGSLLPQARRPRGRGLAPCRARRAAASGQRRRAGNSALRSPRPLTHHPCPSPSPHPLPPPARPCGVSGSGEPGRVTRPGTARPAVAWAEG